METITKQIIPCAYRKSVKYSKFIIIIFSASILCISCISQSDLTLYKSQNHYVALTYPKNTWKIQETSNYLLVQQIEEIIFEIEIASNLPSIDAEKSLEEALEEYVSTVLLVEKDRLIRIEPVKHIMFNGYEAVKMEIVANVAVNGQYLQLYRVILVQNDDDRIVVIPSWRVGSDELHKNTATELNNIIQSIRFD